MSDTQPSQTLDTNATDVRSQRLEQAWLSWRAGEPTPRWPEYLPSEDQRCSPDLAFLLVQVDVECRAKAGLPGLLSERHLEHPRLQQEDARLDAERQVELIRWDYQQRWQSGQRPRRADYQAAFPPHADALHDLKPRSRCPVCRRVVVLEETAPTRRCPDCESAPSLPETLLPLGAGEVRPVAGLTGLDLRGYELTERLGGGMGDVYRACDPALGRDLAVKVIKANLRHVTEAERRFLREARVTGSLQHPGVVQVHNLGRLSDGRLHYTMRLVRGHTLAEILQEDAGKPERLPYLLTIFEKVCQAVAYAHSKRVIHRDLKPANVMVGRFGEVQVMDWGLAKLLTAEDGPAEPEEAAEAGGTRLPAESADTPADLSRTGRGMGTPAYMPPEQARGEWDAVDERADVFALGAILCEMLTGRPPYSEGDGYAALGRARCGDMSEGLGRLGRCSADTELVELCRECLALEREGRPRDAAVVAGRVVAYQAEVQERLRRAELERVAAEARAQEELARAAAERAARRRLLALAAAVVLLVAGGAGGFVWQQWRQERADRAVGSGLARTELLLQQARAEPLQTDRYQQALEAARSAAALAEGASAEPRRQAEELAARLEEEEKAAAKDRQLLDTLLEVRSERDGPRYVRDDNGRMRELAEPTADEQFAAAFRAWGLDVDATPAEEATARLKARPQAVVTEVIAGLDEWAHQRRADGKPEAEWRRLADLADALDDGPESRRREVRAILARGRLPLERALGVLSAALRPVPIPVEVPLGADRARLRRLAAEVDPAAEPVLGVLTLAQALRVAGEEAAAGRLLGAAVRARPREVVLYQALGQLRARSRPPRWAEAVECYRAARAVRPQLGVRLAWALIGAGRTDEGLALYASLVKERPTSPFMHFMQGDAREISGDLDGAIASYRRGLQLEPTFARAHYNLGLFLDNKGDRDGADAHYRKALELEPTLAPAHYSLGHLLQKKGDRSGAIASYQKALAIDPRNANSHNNLGVVLHDMGDSDGAVACYRRALKVDPRHANAYVNLGLVLHERRQWDRAVACYRKAIELQPRLALAHNNLGLVLRDQGQRDAAIVCYRKAIEIDPRDPLPHTNLGVVLTDRGEWDAAIASYRRALQLDPTRAMVHHNLGNALYHKGDRPGAEAEYRRARELDPRLTKTHISLGDLLREKGQLDAAVGCYQKAIELQPRNPEGHYCLGIALHDKRDLKGAVASYEKAIALDPRHVRAHVNLGLVLHEKAEPDRAIACYQKAIELDPRESRAHLNLGLVLRDKGDLAGAVACCRKAIALQPRAANAHGLLAEVLLAQGHYAEARDAARRAVELFPPSAPLRASAVRLLQNAERLLVLEAKLPAVIAGQQAPADPAEAVLMAQMCQDHKKQHAAAARLYADAFAADARLAADLQRQHRYNAACSAALAAGQGEDARRLPDKVVSMFRRWALVWLRDDLKAYTPLAGQNNPALKQAIGQRLTHWQTDPDLAST
jgi:tetratricopeptide (TPR) repeat protein